MKPNQQLVQDAGNPEEEEGEQGMLSTAIQVITSSWKKEDPGTE